MMLWDAHEMMVAGTFKPMQVWLDEVEVAGLVTRMNASAEPDVQVEGWADMYERDDKGEIVTHPITHAPITERHTGRIRWQYREQ